MKKFLSSIVLVGCCQAFALDNTDQLKKDMGKLHYQLERIFIPLLENEDFINPSLSDPNKFTVDNIFVKNLYLYLYSNAIKTSTPSANEGKINLKKGYNGQNKNKILEIYKNFSQNNKLNKDDLTWLLSSPVESSANSSGNLSSFAMGMPPPPGVLPPPPPSGGMGLPPVGGISSQSGQNNQALPFWVNEKGGAFDFSILNAGNKTLTPKNKQEFSSLRQRIIKFFGLINKELIDSFVICERQKISDKPFMSNFIEIFKIIKENTAYLQDVSEIKDLAGLSKALKSLQNELQDLNNDVFGFVKKAVEEMSTYSDETLNFIIDNRKKFLAMLSMFRACITLEETKGAQPSVQPKSKVNQPKVKTEEEIKKEEKIKTEKIEKINIQIEKISQGLSCLTFDGCCLVEVLKNLVEDKVVDSKGTSMPDENRQNLQTLLENLSTQSAISEDDWSAFTDLFNLMLVIFRQNLFEQGINYGFTDLKRSDSVGVLIRAIKKNGKDDRISSIVKSLIGLNEDIEKFKKFKTPKKEKTIQQNTTTDEEFNGKLNSINFKPLSRDTKVGNKLRDEIDAFFYSRKPWEQILCEFIEEQKNELQTNLPQPAQPQPQNVTLPQQMPPAPIPAAINTQAQGKEDPKGIVGNTAEVQTEINKLQQEIDGLKAANVNLQDIIKKETSGNQALQQKSVDLRKEVQTKDVEITQLQKDNADLESRVKTLKSDKEKAIESLRADRTKKLKELTDQIAALDQQVKKLTEDKSNLQTRLEAQDANAAMPAADIDKDATIVDLRNQVADLQEENNRLRIGNVGNAERTKQMMGVHLTDTITSRLTEQHNANVSSLNLSHLADMGKKDSEISELKEENADLKTQMELHGIKYVGRGSSTVFKEDEEAKATRQQLEVTVKQQVEVIAAKDSQIKNQNVKIKELEVLVEKQGKELKELKDQDEAQENKITKEMLDEQQSMLEKLQQELEAKEIVYNKKQAELDQREKQLNQREKGKKPTNTRNSRLLQQQQIKATNRSSKSVNPTAQAA